jgi:hypothetical protein
MNGGQHIMKWKVNFVSLEQGCTNPEILAGNEKNHEKQQQRGCLCRVQLVAAKILVLILPPKKKVHAQKTACFLNVYVTLEPYTQ